MIEGELYGIGPIDPATRDPKVGQVLDVMKTCLGFEVICFFAIATFGLPKLEAEPDWTTWLSVISFVGMYKEAIDYYYKPTEALDSNGDAKPVEEKKAEEKTEKKEEKKDEKADEEKKEDEAKKPEPSLMDGINKLTGFACGIICKTMCFANCVYSRICALPWSQILNHVNFAIGTIIFWTLTEDRLVMAFPLTCYVAPLVVDKMAGKLGKEGEGLAKGVTDLGFYGVMYYLYKNNIIQY